MDRESERMLRENNFTPPEYAKALLNILEDSAAEREYLREAQRAVINILEDAATERVRLEETQKALLNILDDANDEKQHLQQMQKAVLNILDDLAGEVKERTRLEYKFRRLLETAPDAIVIFNETGRIVLVNEQTEKLFGYPRNELIGQMIGILLPERFSADLPAHLLGSLRDLNGRYKGGKEFPVEILLSPLTTNEGVLVSAAIRDVTRAKNIEHQIRTSLKEKETLLQEIHHRVKNNLQIVASLLSLQSGYIRDPQTLIQFQESQGRVHSMALIHEKLYQSEDLACIDLADYIHSLVGMLLQTYSTNPNVLLEERLQPVSVSIDTAVPIGLLVNELVSNALKYAFPNGRTGRLCIMLDRLPSTGQISIRVEDDGPGLEPNFQFEQANTLGLRLVRVFAKQLRAEIKLTSLLGETAFHIQFQDVVPQHGSHSTNEARESGASAEEKQAF